ncbi:MAG: galactoside ABC transporter substrate-binding protein, partial [Neisseriaceae bacterium]|nr:galactoside ABC transporter substrate-binding protein [Neisseriaceae bacterium]
LGKKIPVFGIDATPAGQEGVKSGRIFATIVNDYDTQVRVAVRMAANLATQRPVLEGLSVDMDESGTVLVPLRSLN